MYRDKDMAQHVKSCNAEAQHPCFCPIMQVDAGGNMWIQMAKTGVLHGTLKIFPRLNKSVSRVHRTQLTKIN